MSDLIKAIFNIFAGLFKLITHVRIMFFNVLFIVLVVVVIAALLSRKTPPIEDNTILKLTIAGTIVEQRFDDDPFDQLLPRGLGISEKPRETVLQELVDTISHAKTDSRISAILLDLDALEFGGLNQLQEIGKALADFRSGGKKVIAAQDYYSQTQYYLAAHADTIFLNTMGGVSLTGYGLYRLYFRDALEKLRIRFHVFRVGNFKTALEPVTRNSMSPDDRLQSREWLTGLWQEYIKDIAQQRTLTPDDVSRYINQIPFNLQATGGDTAKLALSAGLIDEIAPRHRIRDYLMTISGSSTNGDPRVVSYNHYLHHVPRPYQSKPGKDGSVGLIVAQGAIVPGFSGPNTIGSRTVAELLRSARETEHIKAVVMRINSGGGSAFASEVIRQEILELKKVGKPFFVSMGTYAASGGYWIAANADEIWASPNSLTGSIGIFAAIPTFEQALDHLGIHRDGIGTTNLSSGLDLTQPLSDEIKQAIQLTLNHGYKTFTSIVAEGRNMTEETVEQLAQGRVFTGRKAHEVGLVDHLGSLPQVLRKAAEAAALDDYTVMHLEQQRSFADRLMAGMSGYLRSVLSSSEIFGFLGASLISEFSDQSSLLFQDPNGMYAHCMINIVQ